MRRRDISDLTKPHAGADQSNRDLDDEPWPIPVRHLTLKRFLHDVIVHPLIFFTNDAAWALRWHDRLADELDHQK